MYRFLPQCVLKSIPGSSSVGSNSSPHAVVSSRHALALLLLGLLAGPRPSAYAEDEFAGAAVGSTQPPVCNGYMAPFGRWGEISVTAMSGDDHCPRGWVVVGIRFVTDRTHRFTDEFGTCCPFPQDSLTSGYVDVADTCPASHVVTGFLASRMPASEYRRPLLRCTAINPARYQLGSANRAVVLSMETSLDREWVAPLLSDHPYHRFVNPVRIPPALRYALGRQSWNRWDTSIFIGLPWGAALVGQGPHRDDYFFAGLEFGGRNGDPAAGSPVPVVADCPAIAGADTEAPSCVGTK
jgi:hypothetical protein